MTSAIEIYQQAYDLDYRKGDWEKAEQLYREITENYPHSDEKEYALVHLDRIEKLKSNPANQELKSIRLSSATHPLLIANVIVSLVLIALVTVGLIKMSSLARHQSYRSFIQQGALSELKGDYKSASTYYKMAQNLAPSLSEAYRRSAELYLVQQKRTLASIDFESWKLTAPYDPALADFERRLTQAETSNLTPDISQ